MLNFNFYSPTEFVFGKGTENQCGKYVKKYGGSRVLIHYGGGSAVKSGLIDRVKASVTCPYCGATTTPDASGCCAYCGGAVNA